MTYNSQNFGKNGEEEAVKFLKNLGYTIVETNWRARKLEIDIIAKDVETLVVVEVKTRATDAFGDPQTFVSKQKQNNLVKAANEYIMQTDFNGETRFDIVSVLQINNNFVVKHIQNAFQPSII
jgi:putative endonuclease